MSITADRPWSSICIPDQIERIPSMLSAEEKQYLIWLSSSAYEGFGAIVDLGSWLGSSACCLAEGLGRRRDSETSVRTFDHFLWQGWMAAAYPDAAYRDSDCFLPELEATAKLYSQRIEVHRMDILKASWSSGPIEILFVDFAEDWMALNAVLRVFGPHLIPGKSRVVLNDFRSPWAYCLPLVFDSRPDLWQEIEDCAAGTQVTFTPLKRIDGPAGAHFDYSEEAFPFAVADRLLRTRIDREAADKRLLLRESLYRKCLIDGPLSAAPSMCDELQRDGVAAPELTAAEHVKPLVLSRGWRAFEERDFQTAQAAARRCLSIPGRQFPDAATLLGFGLLYEHQVEQSKRALEDALRMDPSYPPAKVLSCAIRIADGLYHEAAAEALELLRADRIEDPILEWTLDMHARAWELLQSYDSRLETLLGLAPQYGERSSFLAHVAREQFVEGKEKEAIRTIDKALALGPQSEVVRKIARRLGTANTRNSR